VGEKPELCTLSNAPLPFVSSGMDGFWKRGHARVRRFLVNEKWAIGIVRAPIWAFLDRSFSPTVQWVGNGGALGFLADGFGIIDGDRRFILAERFSYRGSSHLLSYGRERRMGRGYITSIALDEFGEIVAESPAIDTGLHMSYPCTIRDGDSWFLVAEECSRNKVNLYQRASNGHWQFAKELLPYALVDATVFSYAGQWWMFGTTCDNPLNELHIWYADQLRGNWRPHSGNPVRSDLRNSRPGGTPFLMGDQLYRPTQNCTKTYGGSIVINRIDKLTHDSFSERAVREVFAPPASPYQDGIHTLSAFGDWTLIDAKKEVVLPRVLIRKFLRKFPTRWSETSHL